MKKWIALYTLVLAGSVLDTSRAEVAKLSRQVLLPDGRPAAGAKVLVRTFAPVKDGWEFAPTDLRVTTGDDGVFVAEGVNTTAYAAWGRWSRSYVLIDAPGCALSLMDVGDAMLLGREARPRPLRLN